MLKNAFATATIPAEDVPRAVEFYTEKLGLQKVDGDGNDFAVFEAGKGSRIFMYHRDRTKAEHTAITFDVEDVEAEVRSLTEKGVKFEQYDMPGIKTDERGIADMGGHKMAWLKDTEGNILGLT